MSTNINPIKKVLVMRFSSIGDIVLTTPIIRSLFNKNAYNVHYLVKKQFADILIANPYISKVHTFDKDPQEILESLKKESYDHILDLQKNIRSKRVLAKLSRPYSTFPKLNVQKWIFVNLKVNRMPDLHIVDRYFKAGEELQLQNDLKGLDYFIPSDDLVSLTKYNLEKENYTVVGIGAAHKTKCLPLHKVKELLLRLSGQIVLIGGPKERELGDMLVSENVINLAGSLNLNQSASIIEQSKLVVCPDTGIMHIAAAFKKVIISIWGNTVPDFGMYPYYGNNKVPQFFSEVKDLSCRPCSKIGFDNCPKGHFNCMNNQNFDEFIPFLHDEYA